MQKTKKRIIVKQKFNPFYKSQKQRGIRDKIEDGVSVISFLAASKTPKTKKEIIQRLFQNSSDGLTAEQRANYASNLLYQIKYCLEDIISTDRKSGWRIIPNYISSPHELINKWKASYGALWKNYGKNKMKKRASAPITASLPSVEPKDVSRKLITEMLNSLPNDWEEVKITIRHDGNTEVSIKRK